MSVRKSEESRRVYKSAENYNINDSRRHQITNDRQTSVYNLMETYYFLPFYSNINWNTNDDLVNGYRMRHFTNDLSTNHNAEKKSLMKNNFHFKLFDNLLSTQALFWDIKKANNFTVNICCVVLECCFVSFVAMCTCEIRECAAKNIAACKSYWHINGFGMNRKWTFNCLFFAYIYNNWYFVY